MKPLLRNGSLAALALTLGLSTALAAAPAPTLAATLSPASLESFQAASVSTTPVFQDDDSYVFTLGQLTDIDDDEATIRLPNGETLTFDIDDDTTVRSQDGDEKSLDDLDIGEMVVIVTDDDDDTDALSIIASGATGFRPGGPFDPQGQQHQPNGRGQWQQPAGPGLAAPVSPPQQGPSPASANQPQPGPAHRNGGAPAGPGHGGAMPTPGAGGPPTGPQSPNAGGPPQAPR